MSKCGISEDGNFDDNIIDSHLKKIVRDSGRQDILIIDSLYSEKRLRKKNLKSCVLRNHNICLFPFYIRGFSEKDSH